MNNFKKCIYSIGNEYEKLVDDAEHAYSSLVRNRLNSIKVNIREIISGNVLEGLQGKPEPKLLLAEMPFESLNIKFKDFLADAEVKVSDINLNEVFGREGEWFEVYNQFHTVFEVIVRRRQLEMHIFETAYAQYAEVVEAFANALGAEIISEDESDWGKTLFIQLPVDEEVIVNQAIKIVLQGIWELTCEDIWRDAVRHALKKIPKKQVNRGI